MNTVYFLNQVMGNLFQTKTDPALPTEYYIGVATSAPEGDTCDSEPSSTGTGYARVKLNGLLSEPTQGVIKNTKAITFGESLKEWGTVTHYVVYDAATDGNLLFWGELTASRHVEPNTVITIKIGDLSLSLEPPTADG